MLRAKQVLGSGTTIGAGISGTSTPLSFTSNSYGVSLAYQAAADHLRPIISTSLTTPGRAKNYLIYQPTKEKPWKITCLLSINSRSS